MMDKFDISFLFMELFLWLVIFLLLKVVIEILNGEGLILYWILKV